MNARPPPRVLPAALLAAAIAAGGCGAPPPAPAPVPRKALELTIAHVNDHHSHLLPLPAETYVLDGVATRVEPGGFARLARLMKGLSGTPNLLKLHAGDAITGTAFYDDFRGEADAVAMNSVCFDALVPGNHEFDAGDAGLATFLDFLLADGTCRTPVVAANVHPAPGTPLAPSYGSPYLQPYVVRELDGVRVGIVGIAGKAKTQGASNPLPTTVFDDEAVAAQRTIDELTTRGVRHIVLLTHLGYDRDRELAARLTDVDVIVGGDSHTLLGDFAAIGAAGAAGPYPTVVANRSGDKVCIGHAWEHAKVLAVMRVRFTPGGAVESCGGRAALVIGDSFRRQDAAGQWRPLTAAENRALAARLATRPELRVATDDPATAARLEPFVEAYREQSRTR